MKTSSKLTRPIKTETSTAKPVVDEKKIEALIGKGGSSVAMTTQTPADDDDDEKQQVRLIPYKSQLREIEEAIARLPKRGRPSRHAWILQAIEEKLERSRKKAKQ